MHRSRSPLSVTVVGHRSRSSRTLKKHSTKESLPITSHDPVCSSSMKKPKREPTSHFKGVHWDKRNGRWCARLYDSDTRTQAYVGTFITELEAAKALSEYKTTRAKGAKRILTSHFKGVYWDRRIGRWCARYYDSDTQTQKYMGSFATELEAAKALNEYKMMSDHKMMIATRALMEMQASVSSDSFRKRHRKQNRHSISRVLPSDLRRRSVGDIVEEFEYRRKVHTVQMALRFFIGFRVLGFRV